MHFFKIKLATTTGAVRGLAGCFCKVCTPQKKRTRFQVNINLYTVIIRYIPIIDLIEIIYNDVTTIHLCTVKRICRLKSPECQKDSTVEIHRVGRGRRVNPHIQQLDQGESHEQQIWVPWL